MRARLVRRTVLMVLVVCALAAPAWAALQFQNKNGTLNNVDVSGNLTSAGGAGHHVLLSRQHDLRRRDRPGQQFQRDECVRAGCRSTSITPLSARSPASRSPAIFISSDRSGGAVCLHRGRS